MGGPTGKVLQAKSSVRSPGQDAKCGRPKCHKNKVAAGIQWGPCGKWFHCARGGLGKGDIAIDGLLEAAADKDSQEEEDLSPAPAVMEEATSVGSADRIVPEVIKPLENVRVTDCKEEESTISGETRGKGGGKARRRKGGEKIAY